MSAPSGDTGPGPDPVRRTNLTTLVLDRLRDFVIAEGLAKGDRIPSERKLASRLNVSRPTLRRALEWLNRRGAVRRVQGGGTYLKSNFLAVLAEAPGGTDDEQIDLREIVEARCVLESLLVSFAAQRVSRRDAQRLRDAVEQSARSVDDPASWYREDLQFHLEIARLAGNSVLRASLHAIMNNVLQVWSTFSKQFDARKGLEGHRAIAEHLARGDAEAARRQMERPPEPFESAAKVGLLRVSA